MQDVADEVDYSVYRELCNRLVLDPLRELVDGHQHMSKTSWRCCQRPNYVQALACKWPGRWYGDKVVRRDVSFLAK
jgi:hypothetical protein